MKFPDPIELLSFFECDPIMLDEDEQIPFIYNQATYQYINKKKEKIIFTILPSYEQVTFTIYNDKTDDIISSLEFNNVKSLEIISDKKKEARLMVSSNNIVAKVGIKPRYKIFLRELVDI